MDMHKATWEMVSCCFRCLDNPENLIITMPAVDPTQSPSPSPKLSITLSRYGLSFFVNEANDLESRDFENMVYDERQSVGTLFGLVNRLVLRPRAQILEDVIPKLILVPRGTSLSRDDHGVRIEFPPSGLVGYYAYQVDPELGCLKGTVDLESRLYLAHLHALTGSGCRADPLTGRTGVEEAISLIWLAGTRQGTYSLNFEWENPQIAFALARIRGVTDGSSLPSDDALLQDVYLFPSEVAASVQLCEKRFLTSLNQLLHDPERSVPTLPASAKQHFSHTFSQNVFTYHKTTFVAMPTKIHPEA